MSAKGNNHKSSDNKKPPLTKSPTEFPELPSKNPWSLKKNPLFNPTSTADSIPPKDAASSSSIITAPVTSNRDTNSSVFITDSRHPWVWVHENQNVHPSWKFKCGDLFSAMECAKIFKELTTELRGCMNKTDQLQVMFEIATKYIYNDNTKP